MSEPASHHGPEFRARPSQSPVVSEPSRTPQYIVIVGYIFLSARSCFANPRIGGAAAPWLPDEYEIQRWTVCQRPAVQTVRPSFEWV